MILSKIVQTLISSPSEALALLGVMVSIIKRKNVIANKCEYAITRLGVVLFSFIKAFVVLAVMFGSSMSFSTVEVSVNVLNSTLDICRSITKISYAVFTGKFFKQDLKFLALFVNGSKSVQATVKVLVYGICSKAVDKINSFVSLSPVLIQ